MRFLTFLVVLLSGLIPAAPAACAKPALTLVYSANTYGVYEPCPS